MGGGTNEKEPSTKSSHLHHELGLHSHAAHRASLGVKEAVGSQHGEEIALWAPWCMHVALKHQVRTMEVCACNPCYTGGGGTRIKVQERPWAKA
jgi:hypothetical protein